MIWARRPGGVVAGGPTALSRVGGGGVAPERRPERGAEGPRAGLEVSGGVRA